MTKRSFNLRKGIAGIAICLAGVVVLFVGCSQLLSELSPPPIYSSEAMDELITDLKKIAETYTIEEVRLHEKDDLTSDFGMAIVTMRDSEGKKFEQDLYYNYAIPNDDPRPVQDNWYGKKPKKTYIEIDEIIAQKDNIEKYVEEAKVQVTEKLDNYNFRSVGRITFTYDKQGDMRIEITINITEKGKSERREHGRMVTDYYEAVFYVDKNGNVIYKE